MEKREQPRSTLLCPTRGGRASYPNQDRAIAIAKEREADILFLYVSNIQFLGLTALPVVVDIETELEEMGEFMLAMAQERAEKAGVRADILVKSGVFREVLQEVIEERPMITAVVLGSSAKGSGHTTREFVLDLAAQMSRKTGVEFTVMHEGEVIETFRPEEKL